MKLPPLYSAAQFRDDPKRSVSGDTGSSVSRNSDSQSEREAKRLADMQAALKRLRELPSTRQSAAAQRLNKAQQLLQQIRALKQAIALATPEQAKGLAAQLRQLAGQLASLGKGGNGGLSLPSASFSAEGSQPADMAATATAEGTSPEATTIEVFPAGGEMNAAEQSPPASGEEEKPALAMASERPHETASARTDAEIEEDNHSSDENKIEEALRKVLQEAWAELKSAAAMLKAKIQLLPHADHVRAEEHLRAIDTLASRAGIGETYGLSVEEASAPLFIDVKA